MKCLLLSFLYLKSKSFLGSKIVVKSRSVKRNAEKRARAGERQGLFSLLRPHQPQATENRKF